MRKTPNHLIPRSDRDILGDDNNNNSFSSTNVVANADGSLIERVEYIQTCLGGLTGQLRFQQSASNVVEDDSYAQFEITLMDIDSGAIASANIVITSIAVELAKSTGGGAFSAVGITQPTFSKANGRVYTSNRFLAAEWSVGDTYRLTVSGITVTFGTETAYVPQMVWCNLITDIIDIDTVVDDIKTDTDRLQDTAITVAMTAGSFASYIAGNNGGLGGQLPASTSLYDVVKYLANVADGGTVTPTKVLDNSILAIMLSKVSGGDISSFDNSTDSLEAISDKVTDVNTDLGNFSGQTNLQSCLASLGVPDVAGKSLYVCLVTDRLDNGTYGLSAIKTAVDDVNTDIGNFSARVNLQSLLTTLGVPDVAGKDFYTCLITDRLDSATFGLSALNTDIDTVITDTEKIYDVSLGTSPTAGSLATFIATGGTALGTALPASTSLYDTTKNISTVGITSAPVEKSLADILHKDGSFTYDNTTDSLEAISDAISEGTSSVTAAAGSTTTTVVDATFTQGDNYWRGCLMLCTAGDNIGQARIVDSFTASTDTFNFTQAWSADPTGDTFVLISGYGVLGWLPQADVAVTDTATTTESDCVIFDLSTAGNSYKVNSLRLKFADPGANTVTVNLSELINDVLTVVDSFTVTTANYGTYFSLMDMFGTMHLAGDSLKVSCVMDAGTAAVTGQYSYEKAYSA
jgi:hypothetical protein